MSDTIQKQKFNPVFIIGDHRSGTTLLYQTLTKTNLFAYITAYHVIRFSEIVNDFEKQTVEQEIQKLSQEFNRLSIGDRVFDQVVVTPTLPEEYGFILSNNGFERFINEDNINFMEEICKKIQYLQPDKPYLLLKNPWCNPHFFFIKQQFPHAKFIFIHREPSAIINSKLKAIRKILSEWNPYTALLSRRYSKLFRSPLRRLFYRSMYSNFFNLGLKKALKQSLESKTAYSKYLRSLNQNDYVEITYEHLCQEPNQTIQLILEFLNLDMPQVLDFSAEISPREVKLLPEVETNLTLINKTLGQYQDLTLNN